MQHQLWRQRHNGLGTHYSLIQEASLSVMLMAEEDSIIEGMAVYMATNGFIDQIGGSGRFEELLKQVTAMPFENQEKKFMEALQACLGDHDRSDDVTVLGFRPD